MLTISRTHQRMWPISVSVVATLAVWLAGKALGDDWFSDPFKYPAKGASLSATVLMCWCVILSARLRCTERFFGGLDKVYQIHKRIGRWSFFLILLHPVFLSAHNLPDAAAFVRELGFLAPRGDRYLWGQNLGVAAILLMAGLITVTLWMKLRYHIWKMTHELFGIVLALVVAHVIAVDRDVSTYPLLGLLVYGFLLLAIGSFVYIRFLYRSRGPRHPYRIAEVCRHGDILEITLSPQRTGMDFRPSQFVYLVVHKATISPEPHPYSIACGYNLDRRIKLGIRKTGDHTRSLERLEAGDSVTLYGPYGHFSDRFLAGTRDCVFIGGGIGITPFLGMWHVALHSEERLHTDQVPQPLRKLHPELIRAWRSPRVHLIYVCRTAGEASFDDDIRDEIASSHSREFGDFEKRGHAYELYLTERRARISAEYVDQRVAGGVRSRAIFLCGPSPMVESLSRQFQSFGIDARQIVVEDFNLY